MEKSLRKSYFITKLLKASSGRPSAEDAFSLLELVAVVTILGILSSITIPIIGNIISSSRVDEAKALLNTAAADCLQKSRLNEDDKDVIDDTIISDKRVIPIGFKIDTANNADKCSYFQLVPTNEEDNIRFPIGFSVSEGSLNKFANPTSTLTSSIQACERWAGLNCKQDQSLKELVEWKESIAIAKSVCEENYSKWLTENNTTPLKFQRWDPNSEQGCPSRPPKDGSTSYKDDPTCSPDGCDRTVYGLDGEFVGFNKIDYDKALEDKYGKACTEWVAQREAEKYTNNPVTLPILKVPECGSQEFWFCDGVDKGSQTSLNQCLTQKESQKCIDDQTQARLDGWEGLYPGQPGPPPCGDPAWMCSEQIMFDENTYLTTTECGKKEGCASMEMPSRLCLDPKYDDSALCREWVKCQKQRL